MSEHLDLGRLVDLARDPREADEAERTHLASCETCAEGRRWADSLVEAASTEPLGSPPLAVLERARAIPCELPPPVPRRAPRWLPARLLPGLLPSAAGVRGTAPRRRLYESEAGRVDVAVDPDPKDAERWRVTGQLDPVEGAPPDDLLVVLWEDGSVAAHTAGDEIGVFVLPGVAPGRYRLEVWSPSAEAAVRIEPFDVPSEEEP